MKYNFSNKQAQAILDMKLSKLSHLEKATLENEQRELNALLITLEAICNNPIPELQKRLAELVKKYGDARRTKLENITIVKENGYIKDRKIIQNNYELLNNTLTKISKNKNYKYNIDFYKNFLGIELR